MPLCTNERCTSEGDKREVLAKDLCAACYRRQARQQEDDPSDFTPEPESAAELATRRRDLLREFVGYGFSRNTFVDRLDLFPAGSSRPTRVKILAHDIEVLGV